MDKSASQKVGYKTKFKSLYRIDGLSKGKFTLKNAKGGPLSNKNSKKFEKFEKFGKNSEGNISNSSTDSKICDKENKVKNIAYMFGGVKGEKQGVCLTPSKRKPEGEVGGGVGSVLRIFENKL